VDQFLQFFAGSKSLIGNIHRHIHLFLIRTVARKDKRNGGQLFTYLKQRLYPLLFRVPPKVENIGFYFLFRPFAFLKRLDKIMHHYRFSFQFPTGIQLFFQEGAWTDCRIDQPVGPQVSIQKGFYASQQTFGKGTMDTFILDAVPWAPPDALCAALFADILLHQMIGTDKLTVMGCKDDFHLACSLPAVLVNLIQNGRRQLKIKVVQMNRIRSKIL
jgi:hypothetical protein